VPSEGIKLVFGQEGRQGKGIFTAVFQEVEKLRKKGTLIDKMRIDEPLPGRRPASLQVWLLDPDKDRYFKVFTTVLRPSAACIKCFRRLHSKGLLGLGLLLVFSFAVHQ